MEQPGSQSARRRSPAQWLIRTEPLALVLLIALAVLLLAVTLTGPAGRGRPAPTTTPAVGGR